MLFGDIVSFWLRDERFLRRGLLLFGDIVGFGCAVRISDHAQRQVCLVVEHVRFFIGELMRVDFVMCDRFCAGKRRCHV